MSVAVEMIETGRSTYDSTSIPPDAQAWMDAKNFNWVLVPKMHNALQNYRNKGYRPLFLRDVDDPAALAALEEFGVNSEMSRGQVLVSDCVLYVRSKAEEKFWLLEERARSRNMMGSTTIDTIAEEMNRRAHNAGHPDALRFSEKNADAEAHVHGGPRAAMDEDPELAAAVRETLKQFQK